MFTRNNCAADLCQSCFCYSQATKKGRKLSITKANGKVLAEYNPLFYLYAQNRAATGYFLLEMLLAVSILSFSALISIPLLKEINYMLQKQRYDYQDEIGIYQLQILLATNNIVDILPDEIIYENRNGEGKVTLINQNVISEPGWVCYLYHVDDAFFYEHLGVIYIDYEREGEYYTFPIAYKQY